MLKRLIEVTLPLKEVSEQSAREKSIRHGHISTLHIWWARRPLAACRAVVFASLIPDPDDPECPTSFKQLVMDVLGRSQFRPTQPEPSPGAVAPVETKPLEDTPRNRCLEFIKHLVRWENSNEPDYIEPARKLIRAAHKILHPDSPDAMPKVLDPFAGGGAIPLEALRLGCEAHAIDINPVAHLIQLCTLVYPQKFGRPLPPEAIVPDYIREKPELFLDKKSKGNAKGWFDDDGVAIAEAEYRRNPLAADVKYWGNWVLERARKELAEFYPPDPDGSVPVAYLWARTVKCPNPACGAVIPLVRQLWVYKKADTEVALRMSLNTDTLRCDFSVIEGKAIDFDPALGTMQRGQGACPFCQTVASSKYLQEQGNSGRLGQQLMAVVLSKAGTSGKSFRPSTESDIKVFKSATNALQKSTDIYGPDIARMSGWMTKAAGHVTAWLQRNKALLVTIVKIVAAVFAAGAALIALGLALKAIGAAIGVVIGVIGIAKVAFAAFTTVLGLMLTPIAMVIAAVGALGAYLITSTKAGAKALDWLGGKFTKLKNWASDMWTGISDALAAGDIALAAKIMWLGLKMAWTTGIGALEKLWVTFTKGFQAAFWTAAKGIAEAMLSVARSAENLWSEFKGGLKAIDAWVEKEIVNATIKLTTDDDKQDAVIAENERTYRKKVMGIKRDMDAEIARSDAFYDKKKKQVEKNYNARMVEIGKGVIAATDKIKAAQDAAQAELDAAVAEAKRKRTEHKPDDDKGPEGLAGPEGLQGKVAKLLGDLKSGMSASAGGIAGQLQSVTGTFSAMMLGGLGAGHTNIQERTAKAAEATAKHIKRIDRKTDKGPRFMR